MKQISPLQHLGIAMAILVASYVLFTLFPGLLPHPEDFSPWAYIVAFVILLVQCLRLPTGSRRWLYWTIFVLCTLAMLDESGYGVEIFGWQPLYLPQYHVQIRDLHSLLTLGREVAQEWLVDVRWNGGQFQGFLAYDAGILAFVFAFVAIFRFRMDQAKEAEWQERLARFTAGGAAAIGLAFTAYLLLLPADPTNAFMLGFSLTRLTIVVGILLLSLAPLVLLFIKKAEVLKRLRATLKKQSKARWLGATAALALLGAFAYQIYAPFAFLPDQQVRLERTTPLVLWLMAEVAVSLAAGLVWRGKFRLPFRTARRQFANFVNEEPAFTYTVVALVLIGIAQLIDLEFIPLNQWIVTPNFHVKLWGLWTEEVFEMTAAYEFLAAGWFFPRRAKTNK
jgi:hypothetical protein